MLKKLILILLFIFSSGAFACWKVEGSLAVDGETWKINQKFEHSKEYAFPMGTFILKMSIKQGKEKVHTLVYALQEKKGAALLPVTKGEEEIKEGEAEDIYAKGEPGQPHSIITIKVSNI